MNINDVYREICDNPHDDTPRLRFAELIESSDGAWASFIRRQIDETRRRRRGETVDTDLTVRPKRWSSALAPYVAYGRWEAIEFSRGFPSLVPMHPDVFAEYGEHIFRLAPIRHIDFVHPYDEDQSELLDEDGKKSEFPLDRVLGCSALDRLESIGFENLRLSQDWSQRLVGCKYLTNCIYLSLAFTFHRQEDIVQLVESSQIRKVIQIVSNHISKAFPETTELGIGADRTNGQGGPEWTTFYYGELGKKLEEKFGYIPWLHERPNERHDLWWQVETGELPKFEVGSLPPKEEWYVPPESTHHPRPGW